jgi:hypothetical protein
VLVEPLVELIPDEPPIVLPPVEPVVPEPVVLIPLPEVAGEAGV